MTNMFSAVGKEISSGNYFFVYIISFWALIFLFLYGTRNIKITRNQTLIVISVLAVISLVARFYFVLSFEQNYYSDFRTYWNIASDMVENGIKPATNVYIQRALAFNYPLIYVFGNADIVFKISNVILITTSGIIASFIAGRWISYIAAIVVFAMISVFPETYYASLIPTHDIPGSFYLMISFLIAFFALEKVYNRQYIFTIILVFILAVFLIPLQMQRGLYQIFIATFGLSLLLYSAYIFKKIYNFRDFAEKIIYPIILVVVLPYLAYNLSYNILLKDNLLQSKSDRSVIRWNTLNKGSYSSQIKNLERNYLYALPDDKKKRSEFRKSLFLSDLYYDLSKRPGNFILRSARLYDLSSQLYFYMGRLQGIEKKESKEITNKARSVNKNFYSIFLLFLLITSLYVVFRKKEFNLVSLTPLIFMSAAGFGLSTIGENQPRYLFMGYFLWPIFISSIFYGWFNSRTVEQERWNKANVRFGIYSIISILSIIIVSTAVYVAFSWKFKSNNLRMINLGTFNNISCSKSIDNTDCIHNLTDFNETIMDRKWALLKMKFSSALEKDHFIEVKKTQSVDQNKKYALGVFVQQPYKREDGRKGFFDIVISANDQQIILHLEDTLEQKYILLENIKPVNGKIAISFKIISNIDYKSASWQNASLTNFRFARLYPMDQVHDQSNESKILQ